MMNTRVTLMTNETPQTCFHEELIQKHARKIEALETKAVYKEEMIKDVKQDMKDLNDKMDKLSDDVNEAIRKSITGDSDIDKRVTSLETTVRVLQWVTTLLFGSGLIWVIYSFIHH
ncbi:hypothetical protein [uncultured Methanobrevibacter sp.]|uniref:hypothetical protein n=1 Tax=uncultured Methanobrevibacter sp. TaxID=253161 RepID=UPI0025ED57AC|nr:hypothetical protein [uncultured Methanobrevibacter sp.]